MQHNVCWPVYSGPSGELSGSNVLGVSWRVAATDCIISTRAVYCVTFAESEPYSHSGMFVWMSVGHATAADCGSGRYCCCAAASAALADGVQRPRLLFLPLRTWRIVPYDLSIFLFALYKYAVSRCGCILMSCSSERSRQGMSLTNNLMINTCVLSFVYVKFQFCAV